MCLYIPFQLFLLCLFILKLHSLLSSVLNQDLWIRTCSWWPDPKQVIPAWRSLFQTCSPTASCSPVRRPVPNWWSCCWRTPTHQELTSTSMTSDSTSTRSQQHSAKLFLCVPWKQSSFMPFNDSSQKGISCQSHHRLQDAALLLLNRPIRQHELLTISSNLHSQHSRPDRETRSKHGRNYRTWRHSFVEKVDQFSELWLLFPGQTCEEGGGACVAVFSVSFLI